MTESPTARRERAVREVMAANNGDIPPHSLIDWELANPEEVRPVSRNRWQVPIMVQMSVGRTTHIVPEMSSADRMHVLASDADECWCEARVETLRDGSTHAYHRVVR